LTPVGQAEEADVLDMSQLTQDWVEAWPRCRPIGHELRGCAPERWVRFHSLPASKRYADTAEEHAEVLRRHQILLAELGSTEEVLLLTTAWSTSREPARMWDELARVLPDARYWTSILRDEDEGEEFWNHVYVCVSSRRSTELEALLQLVADDVTRDVIITSRDLRWLYHPYDGGADVIARTATERDEIRSRHSGWLPTNPQGL
jgi:hypothetical protein